MKIFVDTADLNEIKELASWGIIDGVTTNPTLMAKSGRSFNEIIKEIFSLVDGPISLEVVSEKDINQFRVISIDDNISALLNVQFSDNDGEIGV